MIYEILHEKVSHQKEDDSYQQHHEGLAGPVSVFGALIHEQHPCSAKEVGCHCKHAVKKGLLTYGSGVEEEDSLANGYAQQWLLKDVIYAAAQ